MLLDVENTYSFRIYIGPHAENFIILHVPEFYVNIDATVHKIDTKHANSTILETHLLDAAIPHQEIYTTFQAFNLWYILYIFIPCI